MVLMDTRKIHVCFVCPKAYPLFNPAVESVFGGAEVDTYLIATELAKDERYAVSFIVADYGQPEEEVREQVRLLKSLDFRQNPLRGAMKIWKAMKTADADIYLMKTASPGVPLVERFCRRHGKRFMYKTASQDECDGTYASQHPVLGRLFMRSLRNAASVIVQNRQDQDRLLEKYHIHSEMIPNGHRIPETMSQDKQTILWVGRSSGVKKPRRFLELARALPEERFVMICQPATDDGGYETLKAEAEAIANLEFIERVPFAAVESYFERAKVLVNTSDSEGFANTFIQACKAGTAILSYAVNPDGFLDAYGCGVACGGKMAEMIAQLRGLLEGERYLEAGQKGREYVAEKHDISVVIERYKTLFEATCHNADTIRVLHVIGSLRLGGAQVCLKQLVEHNTDPDIRQTVYPLRPGKIDIPIEGNVLILPYFDYDPRKFFAILKICRRQRINIIHAHLHKPIMGALLATFFCKVKVIVHEHGAIARPGIQYSFYRLMLRLLQRRAALFIAVSQAAKRQLTQYAGIAADRIEVVYNAVDLQTFTPKPQLRQTMREELGIGPDEIVIGFAGRLSPVKGPDILLEAFGLLQQTIQNTTLVFLGDGEMKTALLSRAAELGLGSRVKFLGFRNDVASVMNAFDLAAITSRQDAFPLTPLELMSMKIPLVSCTVYGLAEIVTHKYNALVPEKNEPEQICRCLEELIRDEKLRQSLIENGIKSVQSFDVSKFVLTMNQIYRRLLNKVDSYW